MHGAKTNRLIVYLIKPGYVNPSEIIDSSQNGVDLGETGTFYFEDSGVAVPGWVKDFFGGALDASIMLRTASARGVLLSSIAHQGNTLRFAISFGFGRYLLRPGVTEERFGLKVVLNSVHPRSLRSIDKTTLGSTPKHTREQIGKDSIASDFGIDVEQDLISSVTGKSRFSELGKTITGKDSLSASVKVDVSNIRTFLGTCYERYLSTEYKTDFGWIDQIADVRNPQRVDELNALLIAKLTKKDLATIWMAVPEVVDWVDIKGFRYQRRKQAELVDDLDIKDYLVAIEDKPLDVDFLKRSPIYRVSAKTDEIEATWTAYQCIYAELSHNGRLYILNNGKWYEIVKDFAKQINQSFAAMRHSDVDLIDYAHTDEKEYNAAGDARARVIMLHGSQDDPPWRRPQQYRVLRHL